VSNGTAPLLVYGLGALGGVVAATLAEAGVPVEAWARRPGLRELVRARGVLLRDRRGSRPVPLVVPEAPREGAYAYVLLAVPPDAVGAAARAALPLLAPGGALVPLANGLPEDHLAPEIGRARLIGAVVDLGAASSEPGTAVRRPGGRITVGRPDGPPDAAVVDLVRRLAPLADVRATANLAGARWAKLALNASFSAMATAAGERVGVLLRRASTRRLALDVLGETAAVAAAEGVILDEAGGLPVGRLGIAPGAAPSRAGVALRHLRLLAAGFAYRRSRSSMLAQLRRGRMPPVRYLNGELVARGERHGIATPANAALLAGILAIARGDARSSPATLARIAAAGRVACVTDTRFDP
jgi:2-dehydropantoate 2-reductase